MKMHREGSVTAKIGNASNFTDSLGCVEVWGGTRSKPSEPI